MREPGIRTFPLELSSSAACRLARLTPRYSSDHVGAKRATFALVLVSLVCIAPLATSTLANRPLRAWLGLPLVTYYINVAAEYVGASKQLPTVLRRVV